LTVHIPEKLNTIDSEFQSKATSNISEKSSG
jgi:hypothetical protein